MAKKKLVFSYIYLLFYLFTSKNNKYTYMQSIYKRKREKEKKKKRKYIYKEFERKVLAHLAHPVILTTYRFILDQVVPKMYFWSMQNFKNLSKNRLIEIIVHEKNNTNHMKLKLKKLCKGKGYLIRHAYSTGLVCVEDFVDGDGFEVTRYVQIKPKRDK